MLGSNNANIKAIITADDQASATLKRFGQHADGVAGGLSKGFLAAGIAATAAAAGVVAFGISSIKSYQESENSLAQLNATLASTGGVAGVTADMATDLADSLQKVTKFSDEEVLSAENLLLTFTKIGKDIFPQATKTVLDMSTALGQDTKSSAIQLGKALQDPILGVTALRRVGVNFNQEQQEVIRNLVETGNAAEAQRLILKELATEFGGSATAAGETFAGKLERIKNQFDEVKERIGEALVNAITPLVQKLADFVATDKFEAWLQRVTDWISVNVPLWLEAFNRFIEGTNWTKVKDDIVSIITVLGILIEVITGTINNVKAVQAVFIEVGGGILYAWQNFIDRLKFAFIVAVGTIIGNFIMAKDAVIGAVNAIVGFVLGIPGWVKSAFSGIAIAIIAPFAAAFHGIVSLWNNTVGRINYKFPDGIPGVGGKTVAVPKFASGTSFASGGLATVGEQGMEQVILPRGSKVIPSNSVRGQANTTVNITVQAGAFMGSQQDARKYASQIMEALKDVASMNGTTVERMMA